MRDAYIVSACRTPIGKFLGTLRSFSALELGTLVVNEVIHRAGIPKESVEEVIMGNVLSAGLGQNPARQAALRAGVPAQAAALTVNKVCGSGLKAVTLASQGIRVGDVDVVVAGGMESMTNAPFLLPKAREGYRLGHGQMLDSMIHDGLWDAYEDYHMGCTAEVIAQKYDIARQEQDKYALESHCRAVAAIKEGYFKEETVAVKIPRKGGVTLLFEHDEGPRDGGSLESLSKLKPVFKAEGTVTAANASQISDGAAAVTVLSEEALKRLNVEPLARIVASASSGIEPCLVMMAPIEAIRKVQQRASWIDEQVDLYEVNEAFAAQSVALIKEVPLDPARLNVHGGAVALGHPIGASGARILTTLLYALKGRDLKRGIASLCLGGGNAVAMAVELV
ncbi:MAG: acetyl-CoA C-acetyltransferase [Acidobacteriota bacterium]